MRNGNTVVVEHIEIERIVLFILPMRNGNCFHDKVIFVPAAPFYPTYEEWKLIFDLPDKVSSIELFILPMRNGNADGLTYEISNNVAFYPTYEEWKPYSLNIFLKFFIILFILPMRNGNFVVAVILWFLTLHFLSYL